MTAQSQLIMGGIIDEREVFRKAMSYYGRQGGKMKTPKQQAARRRNMDKARNVWLKSKQG